MGITETTFKRFQDMVTKNKEEGIVLLGCGGDKWEWINGVTEMLQEQDIIPKGDGTSLWGDILELTTSGGRTDIALTFKEDIKYDMGKMSIWRLKFGDCSWISDYIVNYKEQHE